MRIDRKENDENLELDKYARKLNSSFYKFFDKLLFIVKLNFSVFLGTLLGLVIFGLFPAIQSANKLCQGESEGIENYVFKRFFYWWKFYFFSSLFYALIAYVGTILIFSIWVLMWYVQNQFLAVPLYLVFFLLVLSFLSYLIYFPSLDIYYNYLPQGKIVITSILFSWKYFGRTLMILGIIILNSLFLMFIPHLAVFVFLGIPIYFSHYFIQGALPEDIKEDAIYAELDDV